VGHPATYRAASALTGRRAAAAHRIDASAETKKPAARHGRRPLLPFPAPGRATPDKRPSAVGSPSLQRATEAGKESRARTRAETAAEDRVSIYNTNLPGV